MLLGGGGGEQDVILCRCMEEGVVDVQGAEGGQTDCRCGGGLKGPQGGR